MTKNPGQFFEKVIYLNSHPDEISRDEIELKDGTMLDRYSAPVVGKDGKYYGRIWTFRDITEQRRIEQELKEAKVATVLLEGAQRYHFLADTVPLIIWTARPDGGLDYYNKAWFDYTGLTLAQTEDWGWRAVLHPDDLQRCVKRWTHSFTTGENYEIEYRFKRASDGTYRWFLGRASARRNEAGKIVQWVGTCTDIEDQKHAHSQLRAGSSSAPPHWQKPTMIYVWKMPTGNGRKKHCAKARKSFVSWRTISRMSSGSVRRTSARCIMSVRPLSGFGAVRLRSLYDDPHQWSDFIFPEDRQRVVEEFATLTGETRSLDIEYRIVRPDGGVRWVRVRGFQVRDAADRLIRHAGIVTDITERKQAESLARQSQERYRSLIDNAHDAIFTIAPDGTFTSLNPAVETIAGLSRAEWIGKPFAPMVHPDDLPLAREMFSRVLKGGRAPLHELRGHPGLNRPALMEMTLVAQKDESGKIIGVLGIGRDITARKRIETHLLQSQEMETVGKLAGGIAHEFNSILTAVIGQSELLLADLPTGSPLANNAKEISAAAHRAATLTRQLLAYGRKQFLQPETLDLNLLIANMEGVFRLLMGGIVDLRMVRAIGLQAVKADAGQIEQVITNLVINARDAMPNGGKLTLETANVYLDQEYAGHSPELEVKAGDYVMLAVSDTGIGMSADVKAHMFEPFFTTKCLGKGTGLGLSASYGIIKQSGGHISVYSEAGCGSTLKVYLPQVEPSAKTPVQRLDSSNLPRGTETILLVEDDPALREMAATLLRRLGYTVLAAANGIEALSSKQRQGTGHIDLLFTDVVMPHMSGRELADRVRLLSPHTKILFTSAFTENAIVHQGVLDPGVALLQKPFTPTALARKLREVLDHSSG